MGESDSDLCLYYSKDSDLCIYYYTTFSLLSFKMKSLVERVLRSFLTLMSDESTVRIREMQNSSHASQSPT